MFRIDRIMQILKIFTFMRGKKRMIALVLLLGGILIKEIPALGEMFPAGISEEDAGKFVEAVGAVMGVIALVGTKVASYFDALENKETALDDK